LCLSLKRPTIARKVDSGRCWKRSLQRGLMPLARSVEKVLFVESMGFSFRCSSRPSKTSFSIGGLVLLAGLKSPKQLPFLRFESLMSLFLQVRRLTLFRSSRVPEARRRGVDLFSPSSQDHGCIREVVSQRCDKCLSPPQSRKGRLGGREF